MKSICLLILSAGLLAAQTMQQAEAGRALYQARCASCHATDLGGGEGPQLAGANFRTAWSTRAARELVATIRTSMPPGNPGSLDDAASLNLAAFILAVNGAVPGDQPLTAASTFTIRSVANGRPSIAAQAGGAIAAAASSGPRGLTVTGEVKNYAPVSDAMLRNPDPGDWLMIRRNYQAWSYSPLTQIGAENVKQLQLVWSWAMNDGAGANEPTPIVHNGVMFLANIGNIVQALDARTGELIWENPSAPIFRTARARSAAWRSTRTRCIWRPRTCGCSRSMHAPARSFGKLASPILRKATATPADL